MSGAAHGIPASIAEVTPDWLSSVLGAQISSVTATVIGEGVGIMGEINRVALAYVDAPTPPGRPGSVVVKLPSPFEENRTQGIALGMYEAEVRFYQELAERTGTGLPDVHYAAIRPGTADFVIVMEDLSHLDLVDQLVGLTLDQARAAVRVLADLHAAWWDAVQTPELEWIPSMVGARIEMVDSMLPGLYLVFIEKFADRLPEGGAELGEQFAGSYLRLTSQIAERSPWTLAHQDFRVDNMLIGDPAADEVVVIDWQGIGRGPGAYDLAYLLGGSLPLELRRRHERELVGAYHSRLGECGIAGYDLEQAWDDYRFAHCLGGLAVCVFGGATLDLSNERGYELLATMSHRHFSAALDHDGPARIAGL